MAIAPSPPPIAPSTETEPVGLYEVVNGQVVEKPLMAAFEVDIATHLVVLLDSFVRTHRLGKVQSEMLFLIDRSQNLQRRPDVSFVSSARWPLHHWAPKTPAWDVVPDL